MTRTLIPTPDLPRPELRAHLSLLHAQLEDQRRFRVDQLAALSEPHPPLPAPRTDTAARAEDPEITAMLAAGARRALADIETALHRMRTGRYGTCLHCGGPIPLEQLATLPQTALCLDCQRHRSR